MAYHILFWCIPQFQKFKMDWSQKILISNNLLKITNNFEGNENVNLLSKEILQHVALARIEPW